jgi:hypothetical protein
MSLLRPSPRPSPRKRGEGERASSPSPRLRGEGGARVSGRVRGFAITLLCVFIVALAGCGKRNVPTPPPDAPDTYPRPYPSE